MNDESLPDLIRALQAGRRAPRPDCLDDETLAAAAEGSLAPALRPRIISHLAGCPNCRTAVASINRLLADPVVARAAVPPARLRRWVAVAVPLAAAAALAIALGPEGLVRRGHDDRHRAPTIANGAAPTDLQPVGVVAAAKDLSWRLVEGADRYRVTLYQADGQVAYEIEGTDRSVVLPDSVTLEPGRRYLWRVAARVGFDRWVSSGLVEFQLGEPRLR